MQVERQEFKTVVRENKETGQMDVIGETHGKVEKFTFGSPDDNITAAIGGSYMPQWIPDFLQKELGRENSLVARYYFEKRTAVDIGDPESKLSKKKRNLIHANGHAYLCIPENFTQEIEPLKNLYRSAIAEYYAYDKLHPRTAQTQEVTFLNSEGKVTKANLRAIDTKVGGGITATASDQNEDFNAARPLSGTELEVAKQHSRAMKAIRRAGEKGLPFRNPFVGPGKRKYLVAYVAQ